jgi:hypothetical protein
MKARKRKPGAGRKSAGPFKGQFSNFSTRIQIETRQALEAEAEAAGQSVSQMAQRLLWLGIKEKRKRERPDAVQALCYIIAELAELVCNLKKPEEDWRTNPFMFEAFSVAIQKFMDAIRPSGEMRPPAREEAPFGGPLDTPDARAEWAVTVLWRFLQAAKPEPVTADMFNVALPLDWLTEMERDAFGMAKAREALQIDIARTRS